MSGIPITFLEQVDSTSTWVQSQLEKQVKAPFAVVADSQLAGRGRRGRHWSSPKGNIYLSMAIPADWCTDREAMRLLPIWSAVLLAKSIQAKTQLGLTLKWPNDLLFGGRKVAGVLCEGSVLGEQFGDVIIGVGVNVMTPPEISAPEDGNAEIRHPVAATLHEICGWSGDVRKLAAGIADFFFSHWRNFKADDLLNELGQMGLPQYCPWRSENGIWYSMLPLDPQANLRLRRMAGENEETAELASANHHFVLAYQSLSGSTTKGVPLVVADVGNTRIKLAIWKQHTRGGTPDAFTQFLLNDAGSDGLPKDTDQFVKQVKSILLDAGIPVKGWPVFAVSVNGPGLKSLTAMLLKTGLQVSVLSKRCIRLVSDYDVGGLGADRLASIEGWLSGSQNPALIVSCGTALTVDVLAANGRHLGGFIGPGLATSLRALHEHTAMLPLLAPLAPEDCLQIGRDTRSAMAAGAAQMAAGLVLRAMTLAANADAGIRQIVLTGGGAELLAAVLTPALAGAEIRMEVVPDLILKGARTLALGGDGFGFAK